MRAPDSRVSPPDRCRILCVDDDPVSQRILTAALTRPGWFVACVSDGQQAVDRFAGDPAGFDLLVTDHAMPNLNGVELVRRLRELGFAGEVIVVTAGLLLEDAARYRELGAGFLLLKPIDVSRLRGAVMAALFAADTREPEEPPSLRGEGSESTRSPAE